GVQQDDLGAAPAAGDERLHHAAVVAAQHADAGAGALQRQRGGEPGGALVELGEREDALVVDQGGAGRGAGGGRGGQPGERGAPAPQRAELPERAAGPAGEQQAGAQQERREIADVTDPAAYPGSVYRPRVRHPASSVMSSHVTQPPPGGTRAAAAAPPSVVTDE